MIMIEYVTESEEQTRDAGRNFAKMLKPGSVVCLGGEPGAGKSVFVRGIADFLGVKEHITSPTFVLANLYESGKLPLFHVDAYRLTPGDAEDLGFEDFFECGGISAIEWPNNIEEIIPSDAYQVSIDKNLDISDDYRKITITRKDETL